MSIKINRRKWNSLSLLLAASFFFVAGGALLNALISYSSSEETGSSVAGSLSIAAYFSGYLFGAQLTPKLVGLFGIRACFKIFAVSLAATAVVFSLSYDFALWLSLQGISGFFMAGLYVCAEGRVQTSTSNESRGRILAFYMFLWFTGTAFGQALMEQNTVPFSYLFWIAGGLFLVSTVLFGFTEKSHLKIETSIPSAKHAISLRACWDISPLALSASLIVGISYSAALGLTLVYASAAGFNQQDAALFAAIFVIGAAISQYPIGWFSDTHGRRTTIAAATGIAALAAFSASIFPDTVWPAAFIFGAFGLPIYTAAASLLADKVEREQQVSASSKMISLNAAGSLIGPVLIGALMEYVGPNGLFITLAAAHGALLLLWGTNYGRSKQYKNPEGTSSCPN